MQTKGRILAVDPGSKRIGLALSDPQGLLATPLRVIPHLQLRIDCDRIIEIAQENLVVTIVVGQPIGNSDEVTRGMRHSQKIAEQLSKNSSIPIVLWDESMSTIDAHDIAVSFGRGRKSRKGHMDEQAAAIILQSYLDSQSEGDKQR